MDAVFLDLLNRSFAAGWLVLAVILMRMVLKKAPKSIRCVLWALVGIRLICPFSFESVLSLIPSAETVPREIVYAAAPAIDSGVKVIDNVVNTTVMSSLTPEPVASVNPVQVWLAVGAGIWLVGVAVMLGCALFSYIRIRRKVAPSVSLGSGVYLCDYISSPFILGIIRPMIYLPSTLPSQEADFVLAHERAHLRRRDHWWKPLGFVLLAVYWFNPLMWVAYILLCRDIELACDEWVVRDMDVPGKKKYSEALLSCSVPRHMIAACPLAFGEVGVKERVKSVLNYKKPTFWVLVAAVTACAVLAVCFLTNPKSQAEPEAGSVDIYVDTEVDTSALEGIAEISSQARHQLGSALESTSIKLFDPQFLGELLFTGCQYNDTYGVAYFEKSGDSTEDGYSLGAAVKNEDIGVIDNGNILLTSFVPDERLTLAFLFLSQECTSMDWNGDYSKTIAIDHSPALVVMDAPDNDYSYNIHTKTYGTISTRITHPEDTWEKGHGPCEVFWGNDMTYTLPSGWQMADQKADKDFRFVLYSTSFRSEDTEDGRILVQYVSNYYYEKTFLTELADGMDTQRAVISLYSGTSYTEPGSSHWRYLTIPGIDGVCILQNLADDAWWDTYGQEAMGILGTFRLPNCMLKREEILSLAEKSCPEHSGDTVTATLNTADACWEVCFYQGDTCAETVYFDTMGNPLEGHSHQEDPAHHKSQATDTHDTQHHADDHH